MRMTRGSFILVALMGVLCFAPTTFSDERRNGNGINNEKLVAGEKSVVSINNSTILKNRNDSVTPEKPFGKVITSQSASIAIGDVTKSENSTSTSKSYERVEHFDKDGAHQPTINGGALLRGFYVLVGLSVLALAYIVFRSFRLTKHRPQMVRKYGVLAHRQDIEMRPLPLDEEDDDDTTVFDVSGLAESSKNQS